MKPFNCIDIEIQNLIKKIRLIAFDFDGVFTDNKVFVFENGNEAVTCYRGDGIGLNKLKDMGIHVKIISSEINPLVMNRAEKLGVKAINNVQNKKSELLKIMHNLNITKDQVAFVGNDVNDLSCMNFVAFPITVNDAHPDVLGHALYKTCNNGGNGAEREICDLFENINNKG